MHCLLHKMHPSDKYLEYCSKDWDRYQQMFNEFNGCNHEYIPYPYTKEMMVGWFERYNQDVRPNFLGAPAQISWDGPPDEVGQQCVDGFKNNAKQFLRDLIPQLILDSP